jgi:hypothetical protein
MLRFAFLLCIALGGCGRSQNDSAQVTMTLPPPSEAPTNAGFSVDATSSSR